MKRYFIADPHFGATPKLIRGMLRRYPGTNVLFKSTEDHDHHLIGAINCVVGEHDELHVLGDFASHNPGKYRALIKCKHVFLTRGNHDPVEKSRNVFGDIPWSRMVKLRDGEGNSLRAILTHTPQAFWIGSHLGWAHLYGHTHGQREETLDRWLGTERRSLDVGVDAIRQEFGDYFPLDEHELYHILSSRAGHDHPDFYHKLQAERDEAHGF